MSSRHPLGWLVWPLLLFIATVDALAYADGLPAFLQAAPGADKVLHFTLFGGAAFMLHLWLGGRMRQFGPVRVPVGGAWLVVLSCIDEGAQLASRVRTPDWGDLACDLLGIATFLWLARGLPWSRTHAPGRSDRFQHASAQGTHSARTR